MNRIRFVGGWFLALLVSCSPVSAAPADLLATIRGGTGDVLLTNTGSSPINFNFYSITHAFPSAQLRSANWRPITDRLDTDGDMSLDVDGHWNILEPSPPPFPLMAERLEEIVSGDGAILQPGQQLNLGGVWDPTTGPGVRIEFLENSVPASFLDITYLPTGDFNEDGVVNAADYTTWRDSLGMNGLGLAADGDGNGLVGQEDYALWKANFGHTSFVVPAMSPSALLAASAVVPEPTAAALAIAALTVGVWIRVRSAA